MNIFRRAFNWIAGKRDAGNLQAIFTRTDFDNGGLGTCATSWAAVDLIASSFSTISFNFYDSVNREAMKDYPLYRLLRNPNLEDTSFQFFYSSCVDYLKDGNVYWFLRDNDRGELTSLFRLDPKTVSVGKDALNRKVFTHDGKEYLSDKILHIPSRYKFDGIRGKSIFQEASSIFRLSREIDEFVRNSYNNGVGNRLVMDISKFDQQATNDEKLQMQRNFLDNYSGIRNAGKPLIQSEGVTYTVLDTKQGTNQALQLAENRAFQTSEIAKMFGIPLPLLNGDIKNNNIIESIYVLFISNAILPIATQFEQSINKMIPPSQAGRVYFEFSYNSLLKTSVKDRMDSYTRQLSTGILSINEIRQKENMPPIPAGETHWIPSNMMPVTPEIRDSYMAGAKVKMKELEEMNTHSPGVVGDHSNIGDDKA